jgi:hypothetical protein
MRVSADPGGRGRTVAGGVRDRGAGIRPTGMIAHRIDEHKYLMRTGMRFPQHFCLIICIDHGDGLGISMIAGCNKRTPMISANILHVPNH